MQELMHGEMRGDFLREIMAEEKCSFDDIRKLRNFYPEAARRIGVRVSERCDRLEYEGSMMFDEYPDRMTMRRMVDEIGIQVKQEDWFPERGISAELPDTAVQAQMIPDCCLEDLIRVLLVDEMYRRRCRYRRRQRFW